ncbi:hypothetical protein [Sulfurimonas sp.]|uniref:hypothetical protein n=1 Tax=Sulfurimonas sp. TaxID=2022749 RepID=UPI0025E810A5|nr:hypothetical protein [Sulfurimonas sp.]MCK9454877.1 hypothetical protein [Sulfurimonas sp.]
MKTARLGVLLMLLTSLCMAEVDVDAQIEALKTATPQERVELMNKFKTTLSTLSQEERTAAIEKFISNSEADSTQLKTRERSQVKQMDETMQRQESQRMNQNQIGSQFMQQNKNSAPDAGSTPNRFMKKR